jgi:two-component system, LuxR family, sensor kinase FixL
MTEQSSLRILIVDDDDDTRSNLSDILELDEHVVFIAGSAAEALRHPQLGSVSAILLDRKLPDATAEELLPRLRSAAPEADVIVITGHADLDSAIAALRSGAADYILKPINVDLLRASLRRIAERRRAEERATALGQFLEDSLNEIYVYDAETLRYVLVNRGARENLGYSMDELRGMTPYDVKPGFTRDSLEEIIQALRTGAEERVRFEAVHRRQDGSLYPIYLSVQLSTLDFKPVFVSTGLDLTERKRSEERLLQSERLAAIGEAMTSLAHESRNALQRSQACLDMLARRVEDRPEALHLAHRIQSAQDDLHQLYEEVRAYAAPLTISPELCSLADTLQEAWDELALKRDGRSTRLLQNGRPVDVCCQVDRFALRQVFRNIFENALAACPDPVEVAIDYREVAGDYGPAWRVSIRDNGPGLTPQQRARIFDAFYTTRTHGTGLGMAICRRIVEAHGGQIAVGNGPGAEIVITIPRRQPDAGD